MQKFRCERVKKSCQNWQHGEHFIPGARAGEQVALILSRCSWNGLQRTGDPTLPRLESLDCLPACLNEAFVFSASLCRSPSSPIFYWTDFFVFIFNFIYLFIHLSIYVFIYLVIFSFIYFYIIFRSFFFLFALTSTAAMMFQHLLMSHGN